MDLNSYMQASGITGAELAKRLGVSPASVTRIRKGSQQLSLDMASRIVAATGGKVTLEALASSRTA